MNLILIYASWFWFLINKSFFDEYLRTIVVVGASEIESECDTNWTRYRDEKCFKAYPNNITTYNDAESLCKEENAHLVTIDSPQKQSFVEKMIPGTIKNGIWIGLKYEKSTKTFEWPDGTPLAYSNWQSELPDKPEKYCVQMIGHSLEDRGKWSLIECKFKNLFLCEKNQKWSTEKLQNKVMVMIKRIVPVGFIYVQLPKHQSPSQLWPWPWMGWEDVSTDFEGVFFRVEGKNSQNFGYIQEQSNPKLKIHKIKRKKVKEGDFNVTLDVPYYPKWARAAVIPVSEDMKCTFKTILNFTYGDEEIRPRNMAVKIWKRIY